MARGRQGRAAAPERQLLHQGARRREHLDRRGARQATGRCARSTTSAATAATSSCGPTSRARRRAGVARQFVCKYHGWRYDLDGACSLRAAGARVLRPRQGRLRARARTLRRVGRLHLREPRRDAPPVAARVPRPDGQRARGLPVRPADRAIRLPRDRARQLEDLHGRAAGAVPRADRPPEPAARELRRRHAARRLRGAALSARRAPPHVQLAGHPALEAAGRPDQAVGAAAAQRPVRSLGRLRGLPGDHRGRRHQTRRARVGGCFAVRDLAQLRDPVLAARLVPHLSPLADLARRADLRVQPVLRPRPQRPRAGGPRDDGGDVQGVRAAGRRPRSRRSRRRSTPGC